MSTTILIDDRGLASLEIPDPSGELHSYALTLAPSGLALWACGLTRLDTGAEYRVTDEGRGRFRCSCEAYKYRKRGQHDCKHTTAVRPLRQLVERLHATPAPQPVPQREPAAACDLDDL